jgi:hypothetical protein
MLPPERVSALAAFNWPWQPCHCAPLLGSLETSRGDLGRLLRVIAGDVWRRIRLPLLRSMRFVAWLVTWPLWKLGEGWMRRDPQMAEAFYDKQVARNSRRLGPYHRATQQAQAIHAVTLAKLGEFQQAEAELTEAIIRLKPLEDDDVLLLKLRLWRHYVRVKLGWGSESEADARFVADSYARQRGLDHPDTLHWRELDAVALWDIGRHDEATAEMADVAARRTATQGATHPDTLKAERMLSLMTSDEPARFGLRSEAL